MLVLTALLLALLPAVVILYPVLRRRAAIDPVDDEAGPRAELARRWDSALAGLKNTELEHSIGNLSDEDYAWIREQHMTEAIPHHKEDYYKQYYKTNNNNNWQKRKKVVYVCERPED